MSKRARLRVLQLGKYYHPYRGGMETHLKMLCEALNSRIELTVLVSGDQRQTSHAMVDGVRVIRAGTLGRFSAAPICPSLPFLIGQIPADIVHIHVPHPTAIMSYFAASRRTPLVITYHSDTIRQRVLGKIFEPFLNRAMAQASIICTSPNYLESSHLLSRHRERCHVIPLAIDPSELERPDPGAVAEIRARYGPRILLAVGRLVYYKGLEFLIRAMREVSGHLLIIGRGPLREKLQTQARDLGVADRVTLLGEVPDIQPHYHAADVFVLPSVARSEAFGIVQLEAMACGKPVVNTQLDSGVPYVSVDGVTGLTVPARDSGALAAALGLLLDRPELRKQYGAAALHRVLTHFSVEGMADATLRVFEEVAYRPKRTRVGSIRSEEPKRTTGAA
jgi:glycosyltransferase involved in cell wall biosynthesis